ncbi:MAG: OmpA family protein [Myxococcota bacterium]|nr:OmpA family protein [Myxococcota bacterium]
MSRPLVRFVTAAALLAGCAKKPPVKAAARDVPPPPTATATTTPATPTLGVTDDLARQCSLRLGEPAQAPKFDYDRDELAPPDRDVLEQVATCLTRGPLKGRAVRLVGRADPRGTTEYNLGLGSRRASVVEQYLQRLGVTSQQLAISTRGDLDASGQDEEGWRTDRRVDLELVN